MKSIQSSINIIILFIVSTLITIMLISLITNISIIKLISNSEVLSVLIVAFPIALVYAIDIEHKQNSKKVEEVSHVLNMTTNLNETYLNLTKKFDTNLNSLKSNIPDKQNSGIQALTSNQKANFAYFSRGLESIIYAERNVFMQDKEKIVFPIVNPVELFNKYNTIPRNFWKDESTNCLTTLIPRVIENYCENINARRSVNQEGYLDNHEIDQEMINNMMILETYRGLDLTNDRMNIFNKFQMGKLEVDGKIFLECKIDFSNLLEHIKDETDSIREFFEDGILKDQYFKENEFDKCMILILNDDKYDTKTYKIDQIGDFTNCKFKVASSSKFNEYFENLNKQCTTDEAKKENKTSNYEDKNNLFNDIRESINLKSFLNDNSYYSILKKDINQEIDINNKKIKLIKEKIIEWLNEKGLDINSNDDLILYSRDYSYMPPIKDTVEFSGWHSLKADREEIEKRNNYVFIIESENNFEVFIFTREKFKELIQHKTISKSGKYNFYISKLIK